jgi:hypothetical protein
VNTEPVNTEPVNTEPVNTEPVNNNNKAKKNSLYIDYGSNVNPIPNIKSSIAKRFKR